MELVFVNKVGMEGKKNVIFHMHHESFLFPDIVHLRVALMTAPDMGNAR